MKIAVSSQDFRKVSGHAGQARRWLVMAAEDGSDPVVAEQLELPPALVFHHFKGSGVHPLDAASVLITRFAGDGFVTKMRKRGIEVRQTRDRRAQGCRRLSRRPPRAAPLAPADVAALQGP